MPTKLLALAAIAPTAAFAQPSVETTDCKTRFANLSAHINEVEIDSCLAQVNAGRVRYVEVYASATPPGSSALNLRLSRQRAEAVAAYLKERFPGVPMSVREGGENPTHGRSAQIRLVLEPKTMKVTVLGTPAALPKTSRSAEITQASASSAAAWRLGARASGERLQSNGTTYAGTGFELSWRRRPMAAGPRLELGLGATSLTNDDKLDLRAVRVTAGVLVGKQFVAGARGIVGSLWTNNTRVFDGGGELRAGYERGALSAMAFGTLTRNLRGAGLDLGVRF